MSFRLRFSKRAARDIEAVLAHTLQEFGQQQYEVYKELIRLAMVDIAADPNRPSARRHPDLRPDCRLFHIARPGRNARHFFLYRLIGDRLVLVGGLLHDSMDLRRHLPRGFRA